MDALDKLREFEERHATHLNRFLIILQEQVANQGEYVELFQKYPANSIEFKAEVEKLYHELSYLLEDFRENNKELIRDGEVLVEAMTMIEEDIKKLPKNWGKKKRKNA